MYNRHKAIKEITTNAKVDLPGGMLQIILILV